MYFPIGFLIISEVFGTVRQFLNTNKQFLEKLYFLISDRTLNF